MSEEKTIIFRDGVCVVPIIVHADVTPITLEAVNDLADHLERVGGARPEILVGNVDPLPDAAIWVGVSPQVRELFADVDFSFDQPEEILLLARDGHLVIAGRDRWEPGQMKRAVWGNREVDNIQLEYGTANAIFAFLRDQLGILWLWPGDEGVVYEARSSLALDPFEVRYAPRLRSRGDIFRLSRIGDRRGVSHEFARRHGLQLDSLSLHGGHGYVDWWDRFHEDHPEYFALQPDGSRTAYPRPRRAKLCQSNPQVLEQLLADIGAALEAEPWLSVINVSPNDSAFSGVCVCTECQALDHPDAREYTFDWAGSSERRPGLSNRYFDFANRIAREVKERFPDRELFVNGGAYHGSVDAPIGFDLEDNVIIMFVGRFPLCGPERRAEETAALETWRGNRARNMVYRPNQWVAAGSHGIPQVAPTKLIEDLGQVMSFDNMIGLWVDTVWEHWSTTGPHLYLMARLGWDPDLDGAALLDEYYQRGFGPAAEPIRDYWLLMEEEFGDLPYRANFRQISDSTFSDSFRQQAASLLQQAAEAVKDEPEVFAQRVAFVRSGFDYTCALYDAVRGVEGRDAAHLQAVISEVSNTFPAALNVSFIQRNMGRVELEIPRGTE